MAGGVAKGTSSSLSESKLQSILSYLDEMEKVDEGVGVPALPDQGNL